MKILPHRERELKENIRDVLAVNPLVSARSMQRIMLNNTGYSVSDKYLAKLMVKIQREAVIRSDRKTRNQRLAEVRERHRVHLDFLQRVIHWKPEFLKEYGLTRPSLKERVAAIRCMSQMEIALMKAEVVIGAFETGENVSIELSEERVSRTVRIQKGKEYHGDDATPR